jgi:hypothetical protein
MFGSSNNLTHTVSPSNDLTAFHICTVVLVTNGPRKNSNVDEQSVRLEKHSLTHKF